MQVLSGEIRKQYSDFLQTKHWDYFVTVTYRSPRKEPYYALNGAWRVLKSNHVGKAFLVAEPHQTGDLHLHGLVAGYPPGWKPEMSLPFDMWGDLYKAFGRSAVSPIAEIGGVTSYCAKYVLKSEYSADLYELFGNQVAWSI